MIKYLAFLQICLIVVSCSSDSSMAPASRGDSVIIKYMSGCGGVLKAAKPVMYDMPFEVDEKGYCEKELLYWQYNASIQVLNILNTRVCLNCCGDRDINAFTDNGQLVIREKDQPENGTDRCRCMCCYDFYAELSGVAPGKRAIRLELTVDDSTRVKWSGEIDLSGHSGTVVINDTALSSGCPK